MGERIVHSVISDAQININSTDITQGCHTFKMDQGSSVTVERGLNESIGVSATSNGLTVESKILNGLNGKIDIYTTTIIKGNFSTNIPKPIGEPIDPDQPMGTIVVFERSNS